MPHSPIKIATFNVRNLSLNCTKEKLDKIAEIILDNDFDIVALQEVLSQGKMINWNFGNKKSVGQVAAYKRSLLGRLGEHDPDHPDRWDSRWKGPDITRKDYPFTGDARGEGYAFLWRTDRFKLPQNSKGNDSEPQIFSRYKVKAEEGQIRLIRDPLYGRFLYIPDDKFEIRLINTHIVYGKPKEENMKVELDYGATKMRKNEFNILAGEIYKSINDNHMDTVYTSAYTILLGDYNMNLESSNAGYPYVPDIACFDPQGKLMNTDKGGYQITTIQDNLSTIKTDGSDYSHNYDHFSYNDRMKELIEKKDKPVSLANLDKSFNNLDEYKKIVSDHVPVVIEINI